jgi:Ser/Thr protein kinase RdoA (MazF antagonist)
MGLDPVAPDWPVVTDGEAEAVLAEYPEAGGVERIAFVSPRPFSSAALVETGRGALFLKRHHKTVRDAAGLIEEHRFMAHLRRAGSPVPEVLRNGHGGTTTEAGDWVCEVHRPAEGVDLYRDAISWSPFLGVDHAFAAGRALARLHKAAEGFFEPRRAVRALVSSFTIFAAEDPFPVLDSYVAARPRLAAYLTLHPGWREDIRTSLGPFHETLRPFLPSLPSLWTHNDWHASNLTWTSDRADADVSMVLDFGLADRTCALYDLATAIERNTVEWLKLPASSVVHVDLVDALLDGYASVLPLSSGQFSAIAALLPLVHAEFALSEADYFFGITGCRENADLAFETFLLGHACWFGTAEGRDLLAHVSGKRRRNRRVGTGLGLHQVGSRSHHHL